MVIAETSIVLHFDAFCFNSYVMAFFFFFLLSRNIYNY